MSGGDKNQRRHSTPKERGGFFDSTVKLCCPKQIIRYCAIWVRSAIIMRFWLCEQGFQALCITQLLKTRGTGRCASCIIKSTHARLGEKYKIAIFLGSRLHTRTGKRHFLTCIFRHMKSSGCSYHLFRFYTSI